MTDYPFRPDHADPGVTAMHADRRALQSQTRTDWKPVSPFELMGLPDDREKRYRLLEEYRQARARGYTAPFTPRRNARPPARQDGPYAPGFNDPDPWENVK